MENQVELENNNQPQPPTYTKGLFLNLQQAFGKENLPDEATFTKKITTDKVYRDGVHKNLIAAYGQENVPDLSTFDSKVLGSDLKKKEQPVPTEKPSQVSAKSSQLGVTEKVVPTTSELGVEQITKPVTEKAPITPSAGLTKVEQKPIEGDVIEDALKVPQLSNAVLVSDVDGIVTTSKDENAINQANALKQKIKEQGFDADELAESFKDFPKELFNNPEYSKEKLLKLRQDNPSDFFRTVASVKWQSPLVQAANAIKSNPDDPRNKTVLSDWNEILKGQQANKDYQSAREHAKEIANFIYKYIDDTKLQDQIFNTVGRDIGFNYGEDIKGKKEVLDSDPRKQYLNENELLGLQFLEDTNPKLANTFQNVLIDPNKLDVNAYGDKVDRGGMFGLQQQKSKLAEQGLALKMNYLSEQISKYQSYIKNGGQATEDKVNQYNKYVDDYNNLQNEAKELTNPNNKEYGAVAKENLRGLSQELFGQQYGFAVNQGNKFMTGVGNAVGSLYGMVADVFRNQDEQKTANLERIGRSIKDAKNTYTTQDNTFLKHFEIQETPEFTQQKNAILNDPNLTQEQKIEKGIELLSSNKGWEVKQLGGKTNIKGLGYAIADTINGLGQFILTSTALGGTGMGSKLNVFTSTVLQGYESKLQSNLQNNEPQAQGKALLSSLIDGALFASADKLGAIKKLFNPETPVGKVVSELSEAELNKMVNSKVGFSTLLKSILESGKHSAPMVAAGVAGTVVNDALLGQIKAADDYLKEGLVQQAMFTLVGVPFQFYNQAGRQLSQKDFAETLFTSKALEKMGLSGEEANSVAQNYQKALKISEDKRTPEQNNLIKGVQSYIEKSKELPSETVAEAKPTEVTPEIKVTEGKNEQITQPIELSPELPEGYGKTTEVSPEEADIEKRRQEELKSVIQLKPIEVLDEKGNVISTTDKTVEINAKYDAELKALKDKQQPTETKITIDSESLKKNTQPEVDRVKTLPLENEDGATFNLDGTKHEGGLVVPVESLNTTRAELTPELINDFVEKNKDKISGDNFKVGIYKFPNSEKVSIDLNIVVDPKFKDAALEFGKLAGQESLFDLDSFQNVKTGATGENPKSFTPKEFFDIAKSLAKGEVPEMLKAPEVKAEIKAEPKTVADTVADDLFTHLGIEPEVEPKIAQQELVEKTKLKVDDVKNALSSIAPDIKIELHETVADTEAGAREAGLSEKGVQESKEAGGYYNPNTNTIHLNLEKIKSNTLFHEGVHPILNAIHAIDSKAVDKLFNQVKTIEKRLGLEKKYSEDFASAYDKEQQSMEAVTEFLADFVDGKIKINETNFDKVKQFFVDMMKAVGIDLSNKIKTIQDLKKLADSIAKGFERGDVIRIDESGEPLTKSPIEIKDIQAQKITGEKVEVKEHKLSFVKESDLFDIDKFLKEVSAKKQKIWFWVADQLGRGMYTDKFVNGEHYLDAGASYALDPVNRNKGIIWATGKGNKWIEGKIKESDYIAIISGSPEKSKLFNKQVFDLFGKRIKNYDAFKKDVLKVSNVSEINNLLKEFENFEDLKNNPKRKDLLLAINDQKGKKTPLVDVLNKYNAFLDYNELRDGFYADNDFKMNDIMLVLKPESFGGESKHSTYENDILGKVIGVPNKKINAYDLLPSDVKQKYEVSIAEKNKQRLAEGKAAVSFAESQKAQVVAPYGVGVKEIQYQKPTKGVDLVEQSGKRKEMTEDDKGNYLFFHYSDKKFNKLSPEKVGKHLATGRDERTSVPTSSLYTRPDRLETNVPSDFGYITRVPKEKVYSFTADPLNLMAEAEKRFKKENKDRAFDANNQFAYVAKIASEKGFPITVAEWNIKGTKTLIAKTTETLPLEKYSNIKAGTTNQIEFAKGTEDIKPNAKRRDIKFQKENQDTKIKDFIEMQREKGISDEDIKAGLEKAADRIGLDKNKIDELLTSKKEANAIQKPSPEGILQPTQEGAGEAGGKRTGMEQAEQGAIPPKEGKPSEAEVGGAEEKVGITKKDLKQLEEDYEVDLSQRREKITDVEMQDMAKNLIDSGYDVAKLVKKSLEEEKYVPTDLELNILAEHAADMKAKIDANSSNADIAKYRDILSAINRGTSEAGRALRMAQVKKGVVDSIADVMADMMDDYKVDELTKEQRVDAEERFKVIEDSLNKYKENLDKVNAELEKLKAEKALQDLAEKNKKDTPAKRAKTNDDYTNERKVIIASIKEKWNKASKGGAITAVPLPFSQQLAAIAPDVAKLIGSYLEQGAAKTLDEVRSLLKKDIEDIGIKVTDEEVSRLIAGEGATKKESKNELARQRYEIKEEQKLLLELENLEKFGEPETRKEKIQKNQKLAELRKKIKDLTGEDLDDKFIKIANQRIKANETKLNKIQEKIDAGDFTKEPKPQSVLDSELLQEKNKELYNAYLKSVVDKDEAMLNYERARVNDKIKNESKLNKIGRYADIALNTSKGTVAMFDQSYFLVQMLPFTFSRPLQAIKFAKEALLKDFISADRFKRTMAILHESPLYDLIEKTGLAVFEPRSFKSELRTELHGGEKNLWNKEFEFRGKKYSVGQAFERSTTSFMNNARISLFMNGVEKLYEAGKTFENSPEEFKSLARAINELTGQGKVQEHIQMASPVVNKIIWSPKMFASTLNILGLGDVIRPVETAKAIGRGLGFKIKETETTKGFYSSLTPEQRKFALKEVSRFVGMGVTLMVIAQLSGADDVDVDPRSSGFGTITSGNKTYNVFGRFASAARTIVQVGGGVRMLGGQKDVLGDKFGDKTAGDVLYSSFGRGKMTPAAGLTSDLILNNRKNYFTKEEIDLASAAKSLAIPLAAQDMQKDFKRDNVLTAAGTTIAKLYGANISDKRDFEAKMKSKSKRGTKVEGQKRGTKVTGQKRGS